MFLIKLKYKSKLELNFLRAVNLLKVMVKQIKSLKKLKSIVSGNVSQKLL
jgi:hypothetical protein